MNNHNTSTNKINIVYATNDGYSMLAGISIISLFENNPNNNQLDVYILSDNVSEANQLKLKKIAEKYSKKITLIDVKGFLTSLYNMGVTGYDNAYDNGLTAYARLAIGELFPSLHRILYLDCDTMINGDITELYNYDLNNKPIGMAYDCCNANYKRFIGMSSDNKYFNSGVMLVDLDIWRKNNCYEKIIDHLLNVRKSYPLVDQDFLNVVLSDQCQLLDMKNNYLSQYFLYDYKDNIFVYNQVSSCYWREDTWMNSNDAINNATIFHFCGNTFLRPWFSNSKHPMKKKYDAYYTISPWSNLPQQNKSFPIEYRIQYFSYKYFPRRLNAFVGKTMQNAFMKLTYGI